MKLKIILMLSFLVSIPFEQQAAAQEAKITLSKRKMGTGVAVFDDGNYRIVGSLAQPIRQNPGQLTSGQLWYLPVRIITTEAAQRDNSIPAKFSLDQNYPNPFNPSTIIQFSIGKAGAVTLKIYNVLGQQIETLLDEWREPGSYRVTFDASKLSGGAYFYRLSTGDYQAEKMMLLLR